MKDESWRGFVTMTDAYERFGSEYFDRMERMAPNLRPLIAAWKNVMGIKEQDGSRSKSSKSQKLRQMKIERLLMLEYKMQDTPAPIPPDPDCVPLRVQDSKLLICNNENGKLVKFSQDITRDWQGVAERMKAENTFHSFLMTLNDGEFEEYLKLKNR